MCMEFAVAANLRICIYIQPQFNKLLIAISSEKLHVTLSRQLGGPIHSAAGLCSL